MSDPLELVLENLDALGSFLDGMTEIVADWPVEYVGTVRAALATTLAQARGAIGAVDLRLVGLLEAGHPMPLAGGSSVEVYRARGKTETHGRLLARTLAARVSDQAVDRETGEIRPPSQLCQLCADEVVDVFGLDTASTSFRSTELKKRNLRAKDYRDVEDWIPKVRFTQ
jgi:hypothetical protein